MIRPATPDERADYCRATWLRGMLRGRRTPRHKRDRAVATIERLLATQRTLVDAQPGTERPEDVIGWCCVTPLATTAVVHYCYVRAPRREQGIARELLRAAGVDLGRVVPYTHATDLLPALLARSGVRATHIAVSEVLA